jgi:catechol 2,3-dioxygenase-like lactoylglutathione lyase family enzyme
MELFAGIPVSDLDGAKEWYSRLLGAEPTFFPNDEEAVWTLSEHRHVYVLLDPERAGGGLVTLFVEDWDGIVESIAERGVEPTKKETYSNGVRKATFHDADGNEVGLGGRAGT